MMVALVTAAVRVAVKISSNLFDCLFWGGIYGVGSVRGGSDIGWVVMVVLVMVRYWSIGLVIVIVVMTGVVMLAV